MASLFSDLPVLALFAGQGSQFPGMGRDLFTDFAVFREIWDEASDVLHLKLKSIALNGSPDELKQTTITQPLLLCYGVGVFHILREEHGVEPVAMGGHSLGELSAASAAGMIPFAQICAIVSERARLMQETVPAEVGAMTAVLGLEVSILESICQEVRKETGQSVVCANYNTPLQTVLSGHRKAVELAGVRSKDAGARRTLPLPVSAPFHSPLLQPAADAFAAFLSNTTFLSAKHTMYSNVTADSYPDDTNLVAPLWAEQIASPVRFVDQIRAMAAGHGKLFVLDIAPKPVLGPMAKASLQDISEVEVAVIQDTNAVRILGVR